MTMTSEDPLTFRSILPHEPTPTGGLGCLLVQGSFEPKGKSKVSESDKKTDNDDGDILQKKTESHSDQDRPAYWTSSETLSESILRYLSKFTEQTLGLSRVIKSVTILDPRPPFTKARVSVPSPHDALKLMMAYRGCQLSPASLFEHVQLDSLSFGPQMFLFTPLTTATLQAECSWPRSNPPKFRRLLARPGEDAASLEIERSQTRFIFVTGLLESKKPPEDSPWRHVHIVVDALRKWANRYDTSGLGVEVFVSLKKMSHSCHIGMRSPEDATDIISKCQGTTHLWETIDDDRISSGTLFLDYAAVTQRSLHKSQARQAGKDGIIKGESSRPDCTSTTDDIVVPGLVVIEDYLSETEEEALLAVLTGPQAPWAPDQMNKSNTGAVKRKVQHYGYVFDYETADVLRDRQKPGADCPSLPSIRQDDVNQDDVHQSSQSYAKNGYGWDVFACTVERTRQYSFPNVSEGTEDSSIAYPHINQVTINHYKPGEGIGSHVDTKSAFGDGLISISLNGGIVMEFRKVGTDVKKLVYLPARSLVLMSGDARYEWEHMIVTRRTDTHMGEVMPRKLRVSLTLRTALSEDGSPLQSFETSCIHPPTWGPSSTVEGEHDEADPSSAVLPNALATPSTERDHVHAVYDAIATQWHHTRGKRGVLWPGATQFLQRLPTGSVVADVGCGDGKYFSAVWNAGSYVIGSDISRPLLLQAMKAAPNDQITENRRVAEQFQQFQARPAVAVADCMSVPLRSHSVDAAICIAVMHHLSTEARRIRCIEELARIVRKGGTINIQAWAMEQATSSRRKFASTDVFVPFNAQPKYLDRVEKPKKKEKKTHGVESSTSKSVAEVYSEAYENADFDENKGLVVFQRYCHMYRTGELEELVSRVPNVKLVECGYETGNHFVILEVV